MLEDTEFYSTISIWNLVVLILLICYTITKDSANLQICFNKYSIPRRAIINNYVPPIRIRHSAYLFCFCFVTMFQYINVFLRLTVVISYIREKFVIDIQHTNSALLMIIVKIPEVKYQSRHYPRPIENMFKYEFVNTDCNKKHAEITSGA